MKNYVDPDVVITNLMIPCKIKQIKTDPKLWDFQRKSGDSYVIQFKCLTLSEFENPSHDRRLCAQQVRSILNDRWALRIMDEIK